MTSANPDQCYLFPMIIGKRIIQLREEKGLSQNELAEKLKVHSQSVGRWEREDTIPSADDVMKLAEVFAVTTDYLLFDNAPRDGRVDIHDPHLMQQFEKIDLLDEDQRFIVRQFLDAFILKGKLQKDIAQLDPKTIKAKAKR